MSGHPLFLMFLLVVALIAFAICRRNNVRASINLKSFGFSLEAKDDHENRGDSK